jgi:hypothetical protein
MLVLDRGFISLVIMVSWSGYPGKNALALVLKFSYEDLKPATLIWYTHTINITMIMVIYTFHILLALCRSC